MAKNFNYTFNNQEKKIIKSYADEMSRDLKALNKALTLNDFPLIRHSAHGLELNSGWIVTLINDSLEKQIIKADQKK